MMAILINVTFYLFFFCPSGRDHENSLLNKLKFFPVTTADACVPFFAVTTADVCVP